MSEKTEVNNYGVGVCGLLTVLFVALKLFQITEVATWSWWWVFAPMWIPLLVVLAIVAGIFLIAWVASW